MLDLQPIKDRLEMASPDKGRRVGYPPDADLQYHAYDDLAALVAEVERLDAENHALWRRLLRLHGAIRKHQQGHDKDRVCSDDEILWLHLQPEPVAPEGVTDV